MSTLSPAIIKVIGDAQNGNLQGIKDGLSGFGLLKDSKPKGLFAKFKHIASYFLPSPTDLHNQILMNNVLQHTVHFGNLDAIKYLIENMQYKNFGKSIVESLEHENNNQSLEIVKYLIDDKTMPYHRDVELAINKKYNGALSKTTTFSVFAGACGSNNIALMEYWLSHEKFGKFVNTEAYLQGVIISCKYNAKDALNYLLKDKKFSHHLEDGLDPQQLLYYAINLEKNDTLKYLIWDINVPKPNSIEEFFSVNNLVKYSLDFRNYEYAKENQQKIIELVKDIFDKRDFYQKMQSDLEIKPTNNKRMKI